MDPKILAYLQQNKDKHPIDALKAVLVKSGFPSADVEEAAQAVMAASAPAPKSDIEAVRYTPARMLSNAVAMISAPGGFFSRIDPGSGIGGAVLNMALWSIAAPVAGEAARHTFRFLDLPYAARISVFFFVNLIAATLAFHILCRMMGRSTGFRASFQALAGISALTLPCMVSGIIPLGKVLLLCTYFYGLYLLVRAAHAVHGVPKGRGWVVFCLTAMAAFPLHAALLVAMTRGAGGPEKNEGYQSAPAQPPDLIVHYLPQPRSPGDAGPELYGIMEELSRGESLTGKLQCEDERVQDSYADRLAAAAFKGENRILGVLAAPSSIDEYMGHWRATLDIGLCGKGFERRAGQLFKAGQLEPALQELRKGIGLGYLMMLDWDARLRAVGLGLTATGLGEMSRMLKAAGRLQKEDAERIERLLSQLEAFAGARREEERIHELYRGRHFEQLARYRDKDSLKPPYLDYVLSTVAFSEWTGEELASGKDWPERRAFLDETSKDRDLRVAKLGSSYRSILSEFEQNPRAKEGEYSRLVEELRSLRNPE